MASHGCGWVQVLIKGAGSNKWWFRDEPRPWRIRAELRVKLHKTKRTQKTWTGVLNSHYQALQEVTPVEQGNVGYGPTVCACVNQLTHQVNQYGSKLPSQFGVSCWCVFQSGLCCIQGHPNLKRNSLARCTWLLFHRLNSISAEKIMFPPIIISHFLWKCFMWS